jgi:hypothetical protein
LRWSARGTIEHSSFAEQGIDHELSAIVLPAADGRSFKDHAGLRVLLKSDAVAFTECLAAKMLTYASGRGLERPDKETVKAIGK